MFVPKAIATFSTERLSSVVTEQCSIAVILVCLTESAR